jgi:hypothetical protein
LRAQLKDRASKATKGPLTDSIAALDKQGAELEGAAQTSFFGLPSSGKPPENFSTLNQHFGTLLAVFDSADAAPTTQATAVYQELEDALHKLTTGWKKILDTDVPALNSSLKKAGLVEIDPNKPPEPRPFAEAGGDDEP